MFAFKAPKIYVRQQKIIQQKSSKVDTSLQQVQVNYEWKKSVLNYGLSVFRVIQLIN